MSFNRLSDSASNSHIKSHQLHFVVEPRLLREEVRRGAEKCISSNISAAFDQESLNLPV